jgi:hypothetical protein
MRPGVYVPVGVYQRGAGQAGHGGAEREGQHAGGVGGPAGRQRPVNDDDAAQQPIVGVLSGHRGSRV